MADVHLPSTLPPLFADLPRRLEVDAATVDEAVGASTSAGRACATASARGPALRRHINVYVDGDRATLDTALAATRGST